MTRRAAEEDPAGFFDAVFTHGPDLRHGSTVRCAEYAERVVRGGFPELVARTQARRRERFFDSYVADLISRDISQLSESERTSEIRALIRLLAARSGQLLVASALGSDIRLPHRTETAEGRSSESQSRRHRRSAPRTSGGFATSP